MLSIPKQGWLKRQTNNFQRNMNVMLAAALMLGSTIGLVPPTALATTQTISVTISPNPTSGEEFVEFANNSGSQANISGVHVTETSGETAAEYFTVNTGTVLASGENYKVCATGCDQAVPSSKINNSGDTLTFYADATKTTELTSITTQNAGTGNEGTVTTGSFELEEAAEPAFTSVSANLYDTEKYKGITVNFGFENLKEVAAITGTVHRASGGDVVKTAKESAIAFCTANPTHDLCDGNSLTMPIVIQEGTYQEAESNAWNPAPATWTSATVPEEVTVRYDFTDGTHMQQTVPVQNNGTTYQSLLPATAVTNERTGDAHDDLQSAIAAAENGDTLLINENLSLSSDVDVNKSVTIDGQGNTIAGNFVKTSGSNNSILSVLADNVTVKNLIVDGVNSSANQLHGVNMYESVNVLVDNVTARNFRTGIGYNSSSGTIQNVTTENNEWHGINVDQRTSQAANVTVAGTNSHNEAFADIYVDDDTKDVTVTADDYTFERSGIPGRDNDRVYRLKAPDTEAPQISYVAPENGEVSKSTDVSVDISDETNVTQYSFRVNGPLSFTTYVTRPNQANVEVRDYNLCENARITPSFAGCEDSELPSGTYHVDTLAYDGQDNDSRSEPGINIVIDNDHPEGEFTHSTSPQNDTGVVEVDIEDVGGAGLGQQQIVMRDEEGKVKGNFYYNVETGATRVDKMPDNSVRFTYDGDEQSGTLEITFDTVLVDDGDYNLRLFTKDQLGNGYSAIYGTVSVDNTNPSAPSIQTPKARQYFKSTPIKNQWTSVTDPSGIDYYQVAYSYDDEHTFGGSDCPGTTMIEGKKVSGCRNEEGTSRNHTPAPSEQGGVTIWVRAVDNAGNASPWSDSVHYYYDNTNPTTTIAAPSGIVGKQFTVSGNAEDNLSLNRVYVQLVNRQNSQRYGGTTISLIGQGESASWSKTYNANELNLPDGDYAAHVTVVDRAGNSGSAGWTENFKVDSSAPVITAVNLDKVNTDNVTSAKLNKMNGGMLKVTFTTDEAQAENGSQAFLGREGHFEGGGLTTGRYHATPVAGAENTYQVLIDLNDLKLAGTTEDNLYLRIRTVDVLGNNTWTYYQVDGERYRLAVDNFMDEITFDPREDGTTVDNSQPLTLSGAVDDQNGVKQVKIVVKDMSQPKGEREVYTSPSTTDVDNGTWEITIPAGTLPEGELQFIARAKDDLKNVGTAKISLMVEAPVETGDGDTENPDENGGNPQTGNVGNPQNEQEQGTPSLNLGPAPLVSNFTGGVFAANGFVAATNNSGDSEQNETQNSEDDENEDTISLNTNEGGNSNGGNDSDVAGAASNSISNWWWLLAVLLVTGAVYAVYRKAQTNEQS